MIYTVANAIQLILGSPVYVLALMLSAFVSVYYLLTRTNIKHPVIPFNEQSLLESGPERIRSSKLWRSKNGEVPHYGKDDVRTVYDVYRQGAKLSNSGKCLGWRENTTGPYVWQSYKETLLRANNFGSGLISLGLQTNSVLAIYLQNCPEWIMAELAAFTYSMVVVPIYDTLGPEACSFILNQNKITVVLTDDDKKVTNLIGESSKYLKTIISLKEVSPSVLERAQKREVDILTFKEIESRGAKDFCTPVPPKPEDLSTICYTSGTVGIPKGVMLTHANIVSAIDSLGEGFMKKDDVMISYLPLGHMLERIVQHAMYREGGAVGFFGGDLQRLKDDLATLKPTVVVTVPRLLNKFYDGITNHLSQSKLKNLIFQIALFFKQAELKSGVIRNDSIWDWLVFRNVQEVVGGRIRMVLTSSAPLSENVITFVRCVLGCQVREGYGQTECLVACATLHGDTTSGHVGPPVPSCKIKLVDVPEMEYYAADDKGEICVKGSNVFKGYYDDPERTKAVLDEDGWLHTGDIGEWLSNGTLNIIDRKKHIFKLSQGEYIAPEKIENVYLNSRFVDQIVVYGESLKSCIIAIVVPNREALIDWSLINNIGGPCTSLCQDKRVKNAVLKDMQEIGRNADLKSFEQVKDIYLHPEPFSVENGQLTPTMKTKRRDITKIFKKHIENMYMYLP
ncbi:long-chain-fatty-acid--CoA ligase 5-like [Pectinophora gossypiella]|uniref:long-chain-fatty-acid--CoA ligase 5-like n=1 Tax=Pectinophora gossypiella TaxID=13191 RepID=UPI00214F2386|nr:long-chain-fatty-acid--CoA ligase 5-like [Pectinophora gossypiella]